MIIAIIVALATYAISMGLCMRWMRALDRRAARDAAIAKRLAR